MPVPLTSREMTETSPPYSTAPSYHGDRTWDVIIRSSLSAPADKVWAALRNFHDLSTFPNVIENVDIVGDTAGTQIGAQRVLNGAFHETLLALDDNARVIRYSIDDGPEALAKDSVSGYVGEVQVFPVTDDDASFVLWTSSWDDSNGGVAEFCNPIYQALLGDLKASLS